MSNQPSTSRSGQRRRSVQKCNTRFQSGKGKSHCQGSAKVLSKVLALFEFSGETKMLTALFLAAMVLPAMFLGHMAHEEILSQKAYRKARVRARVR